MIRDYALRTLSRQLGAPSGFLGTLVARRLNKGNLPAIRAAVDALALQGGETVADIGFGGGVGLRLLLDEVGPTGHVHGVDPSADMVARARRVYGTQVELHRAPMEALPVADGALDGWISLNTIYFIRDLAPALAELARTLAAAGTGVLGIGDPEWMAALPVTRHNFTLRPVPDVVAALESAGLAVDTQTLSRGPASYHLLVCRH